MERTFFFLGFCPKRYSGSVAGLQFGLGKAESIFSGEKDFRFASALFRTAGILVSAMQEGAGGMCGGFAGLEKEKARNIFPERHGIFLSIAPLQWYP